MAKTSRKKQTQMGKSKDQKSKSATPVKRKQAKKKQVKSIPYTSSLVIEVSWEACNQVGGIYTVLRSKAGAMTSKWGDNYCLVGPYIGDVIQAELDPLEMGDDLFSKAAQRLENDGFGVIYARWLVSGRPKVILLDLDPLRDDLNKLKFYLWELYGISTPPDNELINNVVLFNYAVTHYLKKLATPSISSKYNIIAHFHEWLSGISILDLKRLKLPVRTIFTTHATVLGRHLAINSPQFYEHLPFFKWKEEAKKFYIEPEATIEHSAAGKADILTTVSEITGRECRHLLGRKPNLILPNGLNIIRFEAGHEVQNLHQENKESIHRFVMGHFFQSYSWNLDKTIYLFTSGRYEYKNKGFDITLEALNLLNKKLKASKSDITVVMFFITKRPFYSINANVLQNKALMEEIHNNVEAIQQQVGQRLFYTSTTNEDHKLPELNQFVDDYWKLRYRRTIQSWKTNTKPPLITHNLVDEVNDDILKFLRRSDLRNDASDRVKVVYHPNFISSSNPLFTLEYGDFVRGCHLGVFPSYYEPWGYTPLESIARGVPSVTSDLSGFGDYVVHHMEKPEDKGLYILKRTRHTYEKVAKDLSEILFRFTATNRRERIVLRNKVEEASLVFDWNNLISEYEKTYKRVVKIKNLF